MVSCVVSGCNNYSAKTKKAGDSVSYFLIPLDHRRKAWLDRITRTKLPPLENCHVCVVFGRLKSKIWRIFLRLSFFPEYPNYSRIHDIPFRCDTGAQSLRAKGLLHLIRGRLEYDLFTNKRQAPHSNYF